MRIAAAQKIAPVARRLAPTSCHGPRPRPGRVERLHRDNAGRRRVPKRARPCCVVPKARLRRDGSDQRAARAACSPRRIRPRLVGQDPGAQAGEGRGHHAGRAHGPHGPGTDRPWRQLPGHGLSREARRSLPDPSGGPGMVRRVTPEACLRHDVGGWRKAETGWTGHPARTRAAWTACHSSGPIPPSGLHQGARHLMPQTRRIRGCVRTSGTCPSLHGRDRPNARQPNKALAKGAIHTGFEQHWRRLSVPRDGGQAARPQAPEPHPPQGQEGQAAERTGQVQRPNQVRRARPGQAHRRRAFQ